MDFGTFFGWPGLDWACEGSPGVSLVPRSNPGHPSRFSNHPWSHPTGPG